MLRFIIILTTFGFAYIITPLLQMYAEHMRWFDHANDARKVHAQSIPVTGGIAIWGAVIISQVVWRVAAVGLPDTFTLMPLQTVVLLSVGATGAVLLGFFDDLTKLEVWQKFGIQILISLPILLITPLVESVGVALGGSLVAHYLAYPLIIFWIVFVMNAINLIDGLDGLAAGTVLIAILGLVVTDSFIGTVQLTGFALIGALLAFLRYNFHPARIFMGDTGSLFIGYMVAVLSLGGLNGQPTLGRLLAPIVALGFPLLDTVLAFTRRALMTGSPFDADNDHIHHRLLARCRNSQPKAVGILYGLGIILAALSVATARASQPWTLLWVGLALGLGGWLLFWLGYFKRSSYPSSQTPPSSPSGPESGSSSTLRQDESRPTLQAEAV